MFVFLHLHAAVVNALDAAQAEHLVVDAQILESMHFHVYWANTALLDVVVNNHVLLIEYT